MDAAEQGVLEARPDGFGDKELHVGVASVEPGTGAVRGFYGGQDYLDSQINWAVAGGQAGSTIKPFALAAGDRGRLLAQGHLRGQLARSSCPTAPTSRTRATTDYGSAISLITGHREVGQHRLHRHDRGHGRRPGEDHRRRQRDGHPAGQGDEARYPASRTTSPGLEPVTGVALGSATVSPINMANAYATIANGGERADALHHREGRRRRRRDALRRTRSPPSRRSTRTSPPTSSYALQQVVESGSGTAALALGRPRPARPAPRPTTRATCPRPGSPATPRSWPPAVMYVRGEGDEQLEGWLPSYFGGAYPAETWTAIMERAMEGLDGRGVPRAGVRRRRGARRGPRARRPAAADQKPPTSRRDREPPTEEPTTEEPTTERADPGRRRRRRPRRRPSRASLLGTCEPDADARRPTPSPDADTVERRGQPPVGPPRPSRWRPRRAAR